MGAEKDKIVAFRRMAPIPVSQAKAFLEQRGWDLKKAFDDFKTERVKAIASEIGEDEKAIEQVLLHRQMDEQKTISYFRKRQADRAFDKSRLQGLTWASFDLLDDWLMVREHHGMLAAIFHESTEEVTHILGHSFRLHDLADHINAALSAAQTLDIQCSTERYEDFNMGEEMRMLQEQFQRDSVRLGDELELVRRNFENREYGVEP